MIWRLIAWIVTRPAVFRWLRNRAFQTPYSLIKSADGADLYMGRWWLFNPYASENGSRSEGSDNDRRSWWRRMLPSVRLHLIARPDRDRHLHDHPWNARTIILDGWYEEERYWDESERGKVERQIHAHNPLADSNTTNYTVHLAGYTGRLLFGQYHRITRVPAEGVWTLFITWRKRGSWGFDVNGRKVPWREYLAENSGNVATVDHHHPV